MAGACHAFCVRHRVRVLRHLDDVVALQRVFKEYYVLLVKLKYGVELDIDKPVSEHMHTLEGILLDCPPVPCVSGNLMQSLVLATLKATALSA